jgi:hypothetical protein
VTDIGYYISNRRSLIKALHAVHAANKLFSFVHLHIYGLEKTKNLSGSCYVKITSERQGSRWNYSDHLRIQITNLIEISRSEDETRMQKNIKFSFHLSEIT